MDHKESDGIKNLLVTINQFKAPNREWLNKAEDANKMWNASLLFCEIALASKPNKRLFTTNDFEKFTTQYNIKNLVKIDVKPLFSEFWLREVLGFVHILDAVRIVTNDIRNNYCFKTVLKNTKLFNPNADEDDYSGFIKEILENKLSTFSFHIEDQSKGGSSSTGKKAGERDLVICDDSGELSVIEAFKHSTKTEVQKHLTKIFNYTPMRNLFFILAYDLKPSDIFKNRWIYYKSKILKKLKYPTGYEIDENTIWDATDDFNVKNSAIRVCRSTLKSGTDIYHIMLNVNYFIDK